MKNRLLALLIAVALVAVFCVPCASAVDVSGTGTFYASIIDYRISSTEKWVNGKTDSWIKGITFPRTGNTAALESFDSGFNKARVSHIAFSADSLSGSVGVYVSYYIKTVTSYSSFSGSIPSFVFGYKNHMALDGDGGAAEVSTFTPASYDAGHYTIGITLKGKTVADEGYYISDPYFTRFDSVSDNTLYDYRVTTKADSNEQYGILVVPSMQVVATETSADLEALEGIADKIAAQSDILQAMYGDLVSVCNAIYERTGDMLTTQQTANNYLSQIATYLNSLNSTTSNIYSLLGTQFAALIAAVNTASTDIQAAIEAQTEAIIAYLDNVFSGAVGELPEQSENIQNQIQNNQTSENDYKSTAATRFEELSSAFSGFTGGTLSGVSLASTLFTRVWNALGGYVVVYTFPLYLALGLLVIGRLSRSSGRGSRKEDDSGA